MSLFFASLSLCLGFAQASPAPQPEPKPEITMAEAEIPFAFDLLQQSAKTEGNFCLSPWSAYVALAMLGSGSRGATELEFAKVLHLKPVAGTVEAALGLCGQLEAEWDHEAQYQQQDAAKLKADCAQLENQLKTMQDPALRPALMQKLAQVRRQIYRYELASARSLFADYSLPLQGDWVQAFKAKHGEFQLCDFRNQNEAARQMVNRWGADKSLGRIPEVLPAGSVAPDSRLVLAQALYFKGLWVKKFSLGGTRERLFAVPGKTSVSCPMMR